MSVDLDIGVLATTAKTCVGTADAFDGQAGAASRAASTLGLGWEGEGYAAFSALVQGSAVPCAQVAAGACRSLAAALEDARGRASKLRTRAEGFALILSGAGPASYAEGSQAGRLYSDDSSFDVIDADLANAEAGLREVQSAFWRAEELLWGLKTRAAAMDGGGFAAALGDVSSRLGDFRGSFSAYRSEMAELEGALSQVSASISATFAAGPVSAIYESGKVKNPAALAWWLARPYASLADEQRALVDGLKGKLAEDKYVFNGPSLKSLDSPSLLEGVEASYNVAVGVAGKNAAISAAIGQLDAAKKLMKVGKGVPLIGGAFIAANVAVAFWAEYERRPENAPSRRISDGIVEGEVQFVESIGEQLLSWGFQGGSTAIGAAIGTVDLPVVGTVSFAAVGQGTGVLLGSASSIALSLNEDAVENLTVRRKGEDGRSMLDDWKDIQYEGLWKPLVDRMGEGS